MELGKEIQQKKFKSELQKAAINIIYTSNWLNGLVAGRLKEHDITPQQFNVLRILRGQYPNPATVNLLIERMLDKNSNASRIVDKLLLKKLVERKTCKADRRAVDVIITQKGLDLLSAIDITENEWESNFTTISEAEAHELNKILDKLRG